MAHDVRRELRDDDADPALAHLVETETVRQSFRASPAFPNVALAGDRDAQLPCGDDPGSHFQRVTVTRVPSPTIESNSNSLTRRRAPVSPNPKPWPELQPSDIASARSGIPGPRS